MSSILKEINFCYKCLNRYGRINCVEFIDLCLQLNLTTVDNSITIVVNLIVGC